MSSFFDGQLADAVSHRASVFEAQLHLSHFQRAITTKTRFDVFKRAPFRFSDCCWRNLLGLHIRQSKTKPTNTFPAPLSQHLWAPRAILEIVCFQMVIAKKIIIVLSGKGGVGKSTVACQIALCYKEQNLRVAFLDIDLCGPSVPRMLNLSNASVVQSSSGHWVPIFYEPHPHLSHPAQSSTPSPPSAVEQKTPESPLHNSVSTTKIIAEWSTECELKTKKSPLSTIRENFFAKFSGLIFCYSRGLEALKIMSAIFQPSPKKVLKNITRASYYIHETCNC